MADVMIEARLVALGEALEFPRADALADDVVRQLGARPRRRRPLLAVAAAVAVVVATTVAVPGGRRAVARWFGFDGYRIERVVHLPDAGAAPVAVEPAPVGPVVMRGDLTTDAFRKLVAAGTDVRTVEVRGRAGYWISGDQHLFFTYRRDGSQREQRLAGNTLVWQQGDEIVRVEGVDLTLTEARRIAESVAEPGG